MQVFLVSWFLGSRDGHVPTVWPLPRASIRGSGWPNNKARARWLHRIVPPCYRAGTPNSGVHIWSCGIATETLQGLNRYVLGSVLAAPLPFFAAAQSWVGPRATQALRFGFLKTGIL